MSPILLAMLACNAPWLAGSTNIAFTTSDAERFTSPFF